LLRSLAWLFGLFAAVVATHWPLLRLPYYWDEAGYYIPAAYDFFRRGTLIPYSTLSNAHPPLPSLYLAAWWRLFGFSPFATRTAMCLAAAIALAAVYRLAWLLMRDGPAAAATVLLTALYPVWFVQSTLAHADLLAAAGTIWGLCFLLQAGEPLTSDWQSRPILAAAGRRALPAAICCFAVAALAKEIAIGTPLALAAWELWLAARAPRKDFSRLAPALDQGRKPSPPGPRAHLRTALALLTPAIPLAVWFAYHRWRTGFVFGNPEYLRYNATATLSAPRIALALVHRGLHLTAHLNLFVPVLVTFGCLLLPRLPGIRPIEKPNRDCLVVVLLANWVFFSVLGGALLTRYLLPLYPLVLVLCVDVWRQRLRHWSPLAALTALAFVLGLLINPPYRFAPEDTLAYRDSILLEQHAIARIEAEYGRATVLTAWPATDALTKPELGYVTHPLPVIAIDNFSWPQIRVAQAMATQEAGGQPYTVALVFSTKYDPPGPLLRLEGRLGQQNRALDERFFDFHEDLPAETVARLLGGQIVWQEQRHGQWAAVLHLDRPQVALATPPSAR
jgi:4-amino-4-deoxy-L-arabinose transferase-like glycosyltransferase